MILGRLPESLPAGHVRGTFTADETRPTFSIIKRQQHRDVNEIRQFRSPRVDHVEHDHRSCLADDHLVRQTFPCLPVEGPPTRGLTSQKRFERLSAHPPPIEGAYQTLARGARSPFRISSAGIEVIA